MSHSTSLIRLRGCMKDTTIDSTLASREAARAFGHQYHYDVSYMEALLEASPGAYKAFENAMGMSRCQKVAPAELLAIVKITTMKIEDCGPCLELSLKLGREAGVDESILLGALRGGKGLSPEHLEVHQYAKSVAANIPMEPELLIRLQERYGREVMAELAVVIAGVRIYPTIKRGMGYAQSCSLMPELT